MTQGEVMRLSQLIARAGRTMESIEEAAMGDTSQSPAHTTASAMGIDKVYSEVAAGMRETDSISFRLLGLVPLVSGTALIALVLERRELPPAFFMLIALFAALITLGLFRWELRNVQTCSRLLKYASALEQWALNAGTPRRLLPRPNAPQGIGKTEAEKLIYSATLVTWLSLPIAAGVCPPDDPVTIGYLTLAAALILATVLSVLADPHAPAPIEEAAQ